MSAKEEAEVVAERNKRSNSNATLETVQAELIGLVKATKDVSVLETIIQQLKKRNSNNNEEEKPSSKRICRRRHYSHDDVDDDVHSVQSALHGQTLCSIVGWLGPKDLLSCVQVCKQWKNDIDILEEDVIDNRDRKQQQQNQLQQQKMLWKQAAANHAPSLVKAIEERCARVSSWKKESSSSLSSSSDLTTKKKKNLNYKSIAKGLVYEKSTSSGTNDNESGGNNNDSNFFIPKLQFADLIMFVEAIDTKTGKILGSWHKSLGVIDYKNRDDWTDFHDFYLISTNDEIEKKTLLPPFLEEGKYEDYFPTRGVFPEPYDRLIDTPSRILDTFISFTTRLFRCDTGESFCFGVEKHGLRNENWVSLESVSVLPDMSNEAGIRATSLWYKKGFNCMGMRLKYEIDPVVPTNNLQQPQRQGGNKIHGDQSWRKIRHRIENLLFQFYLKSDEGDAYDFNDLLLSLEGLAWKK